MREREKKLYVERMGLIITIFFKRKINNNNGFAFPFYGDSKPTFSWRKNVLTGYMNLLQL